jgi:hypothetical protein
MFCLIARVVKVVRMLMATVVGIQLVAEVVAIEIPIRGKGEVFKALAVVCFKFGTELSVYIGLGLIHALLQSQLML